MRGQIVRQGAGLDGQAVGGKGGGELHRGQRRFEGGRARKGWWGHTRKR